MRELKFRAWNEELKRLIPFEELSEFPLSALKSDKVWTFEQYTELKDKNGKEIYEGDIVKMPLDLAIRQVGFVSFVNGRFLVKDYEWEDGSYHIVDFYDYNIPNRDFEVIGNIHENKELLGGKQ